MELLELPLSQLLSLCLCTLPSYPCHRSDSRGWVVNAAMLFARGNRFNKHEEATKVQHSEACPPISQLSTRGPKFVDDWAQPSIIDVSEAPGTGSPEGEQTHETSSRPLGRRTIFHIQEGGPPGVGEYDLQKAPRSRVSAVTMKEHSSRSRVEPEEELPGPGTYNVVSSLLKPSFNRLVDDSSL
ncbi:hypothetical protein B484DRAFT_435099, partial [Ochromonadaceae sp. CCMP2298]